MLAVYSRLCRTCFMSSEYTGIMFCTYILYCAASFKNDLHYNDETFGWWMRWVRPAKHVAIFVRDIAALAAASLTITVTCRWDNKKITGVTHMYDRWFTCAVHIRGLCEASDMYIETHRFLMRHTVTVRIIRIYEEIKKNLSGDGTVTRRRTSKICK